MAVAVHEGERDAGAHAVLDAQREHVELFDDAGQVRPDGELVVEAREHAEVVLAVAVTGPVRVLRDDVDEGGRDLEPFLAHEAEVQDRAEIRHFVELLHDGEDDFLWSGVHDE